VTRTFHHPVAGTLTLHVHQLSIDPDLLIDAYTAPRDSPSHNALLILRSADAPTTDHAAESRHHQ
jgi:hypothetical protein